MPNIARPDRTRHVLAAVAAVALLLVSCSSKAVPETTSSVTTSTSVVATSSAVSTTTVASTTTSTVPTTTTAAATTAPTSTTVPIVPVSRAELASLTLPRGNGCEYADDFAMPMRLKAGKLAGPHSGFLETTDTLVVDADGDGAADGIVNITCSSGAGGTTSSLFLFPAKDRTATEIGYGASAAKAVPGVDVYRIYTVTADGGTLILTTSAHAPTDATCCPSRALKVTYRLGGGGPRFVSARETTPPG